jgi:glycerol kinase
MTARRHVLAIDQGTTGTTVLIVDPDGVVRGRGYAELPQHFPRPGWVEHDPDEIWRTTCEAVTKALSAAGVAATEIAAIGITNQRETTILWDRDSGRPVGNAIVWQCRRTAEICEALKSAGAEPEFREKTGLVLDPYFSGTKIRWLLDEIPGVRARAERGEIAFGTVDSWLLWRLSGGGVHATDPSNASRTLCFDLRTLDWDEDLCGRLGVPMSVLPRVLPSAGVFAETVAGVLPAGIPVAGIAGDQQAALFGQACLADGTAKNTYGTGCFALLNTGASPVVSKRGLLTTVAWTVDRRTSYALEGSVFVAGAAVQWLRDGLGVIRSAAETQALAESVPDTGGVYFVPAFVGLGAPYWDPYARGILVGLTRTALGAFSLLNSYAGPARRLLLAEVLRLLKPNGIFLTDFFTVHRYHQLQQAVRRGEELEHLEAEFQLQQNLLESTNSPAAASAAKALAACTATVLPKLAFQMS